MAKTMAQMELESYERAYTESLYVDESEGEDYIVSNVDHNTAYIIHTEGDMVISCDCPHHIYRGVACKHMVKVALETGKRII